MHSKLWIISKDVLNDDDIGSYMFEFDSSSYQDWVDVTEETIFAYETDHAAIFYNPDGSWEYCWMTDNITCKDTPVIEIMTLREYVESNLPYEYVNDTYIRKLTNSNAKYDFYSEGGKWNDDLVLTDDHTVTQAMKKDIDISKTHAPSKQRMRRGWISCNGKKSKVNPTDRLRESNINLFVASTTSQEEFLSIFGNNWPYHILRIKDDDKEWLSRDDHFPYSDDDIEEEIIETVEQYKENQKAWVTKLEKLWDELPEDSWITVIDLEWD